MKPAPRNTCPTMEVDIMRRTDPEQFPVSALPSANPRARLNERALSAEGRAVSTKSTRSDVFQLYLREIGQAKLLSREEEIELASRIQRGETERTDQEYCSSFHTWSPFRERFQGAEIARIRESITFEILLPLGRRSNIIPAPRLFREETDERNRFSGWAGN